MTSRPHIRQPKNFALWIAILISELPGMAMAADIHIRPVENCFTAFGGEELKIGMRIVADTIPQGTLLWTHSANQRTLARGEVAIQQNNGGNAVVEIILHPPPLRDEIIFETTLAIELTMVGSDEAIASLNHRLTLFPRDPLAGRTEWAKELDIELFDPAKNTSNVFDKWKLPFRLVRNVTALNDPDQHGVLVIGEGISLLRYRFLAETALQAASSGRRVILLAPGDGSLPFPGTRNDGRDNEIIPGELRFRRQHVITELDKRLDAQAWRGTNNTIPASRLTIECRRGRIEATVTERAEAWPWMEVRFPKSRGVLVVCGFQMIEHWNNGPTPGFLLTRLLESLSEPYSVSR